MDEYLAASDIAELLGVDRPVVSNWQKRGTHDFPLPVIVASHGKVKLWLKSDIANWYRNRHAVTIAALSRVGE